VRGDVYCYNGHATRTKQHGDRHRHFDADGALAHGMHLGLATLLQVGEEWRVLETRLSVLKL
jgi:hypothetical protein